MFCLVSLHTDGWCDSFYWRKTGNQFVTFYIYHMCASVYVCVGMSIVCQIDFTFKTTPLITYINYTNLFSTKQEKSKKLDLSDLRDEGDP